MFELKIKFETEQDMIDYCTSHAKEAKTTTKKTVKKVKRETKKAEVKTPAQAVPEAEVKQPPAVDERIKPLVADVRALANSGRDVLGWDHTTAIVSKIKETLDITCEIHELSFEKLTAFKEELSLVLDSAMNAMPKKTEMKEVI